MAIREKSSVFSVIKYKLTVIHGVRTSLNFLEITRKLNKRFFTWYTREGLQNNQASE